MRAGGLIVVLAVAAGVLAIATGSTGGRTLAVEVEESRATAAAALDRMPVRQLVGQRVIVSYEGLDPPPKLFRMIERGEVAGVIFFGANINDDKARIRSVVEDLQAARPRRGPAAIRQPLLMMTDQEGGLVRRLPGQPKRSEKQIGAAKNSRKKARRAGRGAGRNMASVGMNVNLAPVLGVERSVNGFLGQFQRAYGNRRKARRLGAAFIAAQQRQGVAATAKHFPGLGAARKRQDTDARPVTIHLPRRTLRHKDQFPYPAAIDAGVELVMINHAKYPALDRKRPASLSRRIIRGELRQRNGFRGVTISDALEAGALEPFGNIPRRGILAAHAGDDLLLYSAQRLSEGVNGSKALRNALRRGRLDRDRFERSAARVLELRRGLSAEPTP